MKRLLALCVLLAFVGPAQAAPPQIEQDDSDRPTPADGAHCTTCDGMRLLQAGEYGRAMASIMTPLSAAATEPR